MRAHFCPKHRITLSLQLLGSLPLAFQACLGRHFQNTQLETLSHLHYPYERTWLQHTAFKAEETEPTAEHAYCTVHPYLLYLYMYSPTYCTFTCTPLPTVPLHVHPYLLYLYMYTPTSCTFTCTPLPTVPLHVHPYLLYLYMYTPTYCTFTCTPHLLYPYVCTVHAWLWYYEGS